MFKGDSVQKILSGKFTLKLQSKQWPYTKKNPAYGRQRISRPIWILAPIPKKSCLLRQNSTIFFCSAILHPLLLKVWKSETSVFHYFSPRITNLIFFLDIWLWEVGAERRLNGTSKANRRTDGHTDKHFDL